MRKRKIKYRVSFFTIITFVVITVATSCSTEISLLTGGKRKEWIYSYSPEIKIVADAQNNTLESYYNGQIDTYSSCTRFGSRTLFKMCKKNIFTYLQGDKLGNHTIYPSDTLLVMKLTKNKFWFLQLKDAVPLYYFHREKDLPKSEQVEENR